MGKFCYIDFEYNESRNPLLNLVSVAFKFNGYKKCYWLYRNEDVQKRLTQEIISLHEQGYTFVAYAVTAEARSFHTLLQKSLIDMKVWKFKWLDLYLEYRMLLNHNKKYCQGKHLSNGKVVEIRPKRYREEEDEKGGKLEYGYASACYKLLGVRIDIGMKVDTRVKILSEDDEIINKFRDEIMEYNESDVEHLEALHLKILEIYKEEFDEDDYNDTVGDFMYLRGDYAARTAQMEAVGYPINYQHTKNFSDSVPNILFSLQREINDLFPDIKPFNLKVKEGKYSFSETRVKQWVRDNTGDRKKFRKWRKTDSGDVSLSFDAFADHFAVRHEFPKDCFGSQIKRYLTFKRNLNGFLPAKKGKENFWDSVGSDLRVRPYMGIFGSQSSRSQPSARSFMFLKSAWMRSLVEAPKGKAICGIDYGSEEFLLGALMATIKFEGQPEGDLNMLEAYTSGDPYSWFAKAAGAMPEDGSKATHPKIRDAFKSTVLALQYAMGDVSLAAKLTADTGEKWTVKAARRQSRMFNRVFKVFSRYRDLFIQHAGDSYQMSVDGWVLFNGNPNPRSQGNWPIQTMGAVIMREAVRLAQDRGLEVIFTLHDALYIEFDSWDYDAPRVLGECMQEAFKKCMATHEEIRLDYDIWSPDYEGRFEEVKREVKSHTDIDMEVKGKYIDPRGKREYENFKQYFTDETVEL